MTTTTQPARLGTRAAPRARPSGFGRLVILVSLAMIRAARRQADRRVAGYEDYRLAVQRRRLHELRDEQRARNALLGRTIV